MTFSIALGLGLTPVPTIAGTPEVGSTLRLGPISLEGQSPMTYSLQWLRNGTAISGANRATYVVAPVDAGQTISLRLTRPGGATSVSSNTMNIPALPAAANSDTVTVAAASRGKIIHDSGAAWGRNGADIALSGTTDAPDGAAIMAEIVRADTGAVVGSPVQVATAAGGTWSGDYPGMVRRPEWLRARAWVDGSTAPKASQPSVFGVGHVIAFWGQSEIQNITQPFYDGPGPAPTVTADEMVSFHWHARQPDGTGAGGVRHHLVTAANGFNTRFPGIANSLIAARPGEKFAIVFQTDSGTGFTELVRDNGDDGRQWSDDLALAAEVGSAPGLIAFSWFASTRGYAENYGEAIHQLLFGTRLNGTPLGPLPVSGAETAIGVRTDHFLNEIYDFSANTGTRVAVMEPHRFIQDGSIPETRLGVRALYERSPEAAMIYAPPVGAYQNGRSNGSGGWTDGTHPSPGADGSTRFGIGLVQSAIRAMGLTDWALPEIDNSYWEPSGAYVEIWSSAGPITAIDPTDPVGLEVNGALVPAEIVNGRLRVNSADVGDGSPFTGTTLLQFADNTTGLDYSGGEIIETTGWRKFPLVDVGVPGFPEGWPLRPAPDPAVLQSTLAAPASFALTGDTYVEADPVIGGTTEMTWAMTVRFDDISGNHAIFGNVVGGPVWQILNDGRVRYQSPNGNLSNTGAGLIVPGVTHEIAASLRPSTGQLRLFIDGVQRASRTDPVWTWVSSRKFRWFHANSGATGGIVGEVSSLKVWRDSDGSGTFVPTYTAFEALPAPWELIEGDLAAAQAAARAAPPFSWVVAGSVVN